MKVIFSIVGVILLIIGGIGIMKTLGGWPLLWIFIWSSGLKIDTIVTMELEKLEEDTKINKG